MRRLVLLIFGLLAFLVLRHEPLQGSQEDPEAPIAIPYTIDAARVMNEVDGSIFLCHPGTVAEAIEIETLVVSSTGPGGVLLHHAEELNVSLASDPLFVSVNAEIERMPHELSHHEGPRHFAGPDEREYALAEAVGRWRGLGDSLDRVRAGYAAGGPRPFAELHFPIDLALLFGDAPPGAERTVTIEVNYSTPGSPSRTLAIDRTIRRLAPFGGTPALLGGTQIHRGDLHVHSCHGEATNACAPSADCAAETLQTSGSFSYAQLKTQFQALGIDWMTATDHSYCINDDAEYQTIADECAVLTDASFLAIPDIELSSAETGPQSGGDLSDALCLFGVQQNHMGAHGITARKPGGSDGFAGFCNGVLEFAVNTAAIRAEGGYPIVHHPSSSSFGWNSVADLTGQESDGMHGVEIWNGAFVSGQGGDVGSWVNWLLDGRILYGYSGSDTHDAAFDFGANHAILDAGVPFNQANLESALKQGRSYISNGPSLVLEVDFDGITLEMGTRKGISPTQPTSPLTINTHYDFGAGQGVISVFRGFVGDPGETLVCQSPALTGSGVWTCAGETLNPTRQGWYRSYAEDGPSQTAAYTNPVFFVPTTATWAPYGQNVGGANIGALASSSAPVIGCTQRFVASGFSGGTPSVSFLVYGTQLPNGFPFLGGFILVAPPALASGASPASGGSATLEATIPLNPILIGLDAYVQAFAFSPNPSGNIGFTNGLAGTVEGI